MFMFFVICTALLKFYVGLEREKGTDYGEINVEEKHETYFKQSVSASFFLSSLLGLLSPCVARGMFVCHLLFRFPGVAQQQKEHCIFGLQRK